MEDQGGSVPPVNKKATKQERMRLLQTDDQNSSSSSKQVQGTNDDSIVSKSKSTIYLRQGTFLQPLMFYRLIIKGRLLELDTLMMTMSAGL